MRKVFVQWAGVGILGLVGWGVDLIPNNNSWLPSIIIWSLAGIWLVGTVIYWITHRKEIAREDTTEKVIGILQNMNKRIMELAQKRLKGKKSSDGDLAAGVFEEALTLKMQELEPYVEPFEGIENIAFPLSDEELAELMNRNKLDLQNPAQFRRILKEAQKKVDKLPPEVVGTGEQDLMSIAQVMAARGIGIPINKDSKYQSMDKELDKYRPNWGVDEANAVRRFLWQAYGWFSFWLMSEYEPSMQLPDFVRDRNKSFLTVLKELMRTQLAQTREVFLK